MTLIKPVKCYSILTGTLGIYLFFFFYVSDVELCWRKSPPSQEAPPISLPILKTIKKRNSTKKVQAHGKSSYILSQFKFTRNRVISELKHAFFKQLQSSDARAFWKLCKFLTRKESSIPVLQVPDTGPGTNHLEKLTFLIINSLATSITQPPLHLVISITYNSDNLDHGLIFLRNSCTLRTRCSL